MTIFDPYSHNQPTYPGLNTGSATQVSTLGSVDTRGPQRSRYRSGALLALAPFLGWCSVLLAAVLGLAGFTATLLCTDYGLSAPACTAAPATLAVVPAVVLVVGLVLAAIGGSLAKRLRPAASLGVLVAGILMLIAVTQWFSGSVLGLPFS